MQCSCGANTVNLVHEVKTLKKSREWCGGVMPKHMPIQVDRDQCPSCGRERLMVWDRLHSLILKRG